MVEGVLLLVGTSSKSPTTMSARRNRRSFYFPSSASSDVHQLSAGHEIDGGA